MSEATTSPSRIVLVPGAQPSLTGNKLNCKDWQAEGALRMFLNNLHADVAERPEDLVVYGGTGKAARNWEAAQKIVDTLQRLELDETMLVQSGKPVAVFKTHKNALNAIGAPTSRMLETESTRLSETEAHVVDVGNGNTTSWLPETATLGPTETNFMVTRNTKSQEKH